MKYFLVVIATCLLHLVPASAVGVTWEQQAERLQNVSASLLDSVPVGDPTHDRNVRIESQISFLPKLNTTIGSKTEKVPSSPFNLVPTLSIGDRFILVPSYDLAIKGWAGYLPAGSEKLVGLNASLSQWLIGGQIENQFRQGHFFLFVNIGAQFSRARLTGAITSPNASDSFRAETSLKFLSAGIFSRESRLFADVLISLKDTTSTLTIPEDATVLMLHDRLSDSAAHAIFQIAAGWRSPWQIDVGCGLQYTPERLLMPRLFLAYELWSQGKYSDEN